MTESNDSAEKNTWPRPLVIFGAGGHAVSVANVALSAGYKIKFFVDAAKTGESMFEYQIKENISDLNNINDFNYAIAIGDNAIRQKIHQNLISNLGNICFPSLVHPTAVISHFSNIGEGAVVMPNAVIGPNAKIGRFCLINTQAVLDHDCEMSEYSSIAPSAATGGSVKIGVRSAISIGAIIKNGIKVGDDCILGANSYLNKDLMNNKMAYGSPAKIIRHRECGDPYLI